MNVAKMMSVVLMAAVMFGAASMANAETFGWSQLKRADNAAPIDWTGTGWFCLAQNPKAICTRGTAPPSNGCWVVMNADRTRWVMVHTVPNGTAVNGQNLTGRGQGCGQMKSSDWWLVVGQ